MEVTPTGMGWVRFRHSGVGRPATFEGAARFDVGGRVAELVLADPPPLPTDAVAALNLWWASGGREQVEPDAALRAGATPARRAEVDAAARAEPARRAEWGRSGDAEAGQAAMLALADVEERPRPDGFYESVAAASVAAEQMGRGPADIAAASGVPVSTVYQWLKEARRRGLLAPARRGAA